MITWLRHWSHNRPFLIPMNQIFLKETANSRGILFVFSFSQFKDCALGQLTRPAMSIPSYKFSSSKYVYYMLSSCRDLSPLLILPSQLYHADRPFFFSYTFREDIQNFSFGKTTNHLRCSDGAKQQLVLSSST